MRVHLSEKQKIRLRRFWRKTILPILIVVVVLCSFRSAVADWNDVPTGSMRPSILEGDRIVVNKLAYDLKVPFTTLRLLRWSSPNRGEIVVFYSPANGRRLVKRVIGLPGDTIELRSNRLWINGESADYAPAEGEWTEHATTQPPQQVFMESTDAGTHPMQITPGRRSRRSFGAIVVPKGHYFVMGDNRDNSYDSRWLGCIDGSNIVGRAGWVALSVDPQHNYTPRWNRWFTRLP